MYSTGEISTLILRTSVRIVESLNPDQLCLNIGWFARAILVVERLGRREALLSGLRSTPFLFAHRRGSHGQAPQGDSLSQFGF